MSRLTRALEPRRAGLGLLLVRVAAATPLLSLAADRARTPMPLALVPALLAGLVVGGLFTRPAAAAGGVLILAATMASATPDWVLAGVQTLNACALLIAGGGAYSVDARLFGRRVITMPGRRPSDPPAPDANA